jgi:hypothetical protein
LVALALLGIDLIQRVFRLLHVLGGAGIQGPGWPIFRTRMPSKGPLQRDIAVQASVDTIP